MKQLIGVAVAFALTGCGTVGGIRYDIDSGSFADRTAAVDHACATRMQAHVFDGIRGKVELVKSPPYGPVPFAILTDKTAPTPDDQRVIGLWAQAVEQCQTDARQLLDRLPIPPDTTRSQVEKLTGYITDAWIQGSKLRVALYSGQTTYSDYANQRLQIAVDAVNTAERYAQDSDQENDTHELEDVETALEPFAAML